MALDMFALAIRLPLSIVSTRRPPHVARPVPLNGAAGVTSRTSFKKWRLLVGSVLTPETLPGQLIWRRGGLAAAQSYDKAPRRLRAACSKCCSPCSAVVNGVDVRRLLDVLPELTRKEQCHWRHLERRGQQRR